MDVAEACRRALRDHLREAFGRPQAGKPHRIIIPLCDALSSCVLISLEALGAKPANDRFYKGEIEIDRDTHRLIRFRYYGHRRVLVAYCLR